MIRLQNIIYPETGVCTEEALYFRRYGNVKYSLADTFIELDKDAMIGFDTYFNSLSVYKWKKYTRVDHFGLKIRLCGKARITLWYKEKIGAQVFEKVAQEFYCDTDGKEKEIDCQYCLNTEQGMFAFSLLGLEDGTQFFDGYYYGEIVYGELSDIVLALNICTYKRENYIYNILKVLKDNFFLNVHSELYGKLHVIVSDNAGTLDGDKFKEPWIHMYKNKNVGGAGGFARGMIEAEKMSDIVKFTHILMMDDDVIIQPESIARTYRILTVLKPKYEYSFIGGEMLRTDLQWFQTEAGGFWNSGRLISRKCGLDLRQLEACLYNEYEEKCDFNAWWYCVIPFEIVKEGNLPLPIFIRGDDVEYGLRNMKHLILMNGICLWHEPFEYKYSSSFFYYIYRNRLIDNAVRGIPYTGKQLLKDFREEYFREVFTMRYKNARLLLEGVHAFLLGIDWFKEQDGEALHKEILEKGYKLQYIDELPIYFDYPTYEKTLSFCETRSQQLIRKVLLNGLPLKADKISMVPVIAPHIAYLYRVGAAVNYDVASKKGFVTFRSRKEAWKLYWEFQKLKRTVRKKYNYIKKEWERRGSELLGVEFWRQYLEQENKEEETDR